VLLLLVAAAAVQEVALAQVLAGDLQLAPLQKQQQPPPLACCYAAAACG